MKKRFMSLLLAAAALFVTFSACAKEEIVLPQYCTVTFIMPDGTEQKLRVEQGSSLNSDQIPALEIEGYTGVKWSRTQFDNIQSDITVTIDNTNKTPNKYTVTYTVGDGVTLPDGESATTTVTYDAPYTLVTPNVPEGKYFWYWYSGSADNIKSFNTTGEWKTTENVILYARYEDRPEGKIAVKFEMGEGKEPVIEWVLKNGSFNKDLPAVPVIPGYDVAWEKTKEELVNLTQDVVIMPEKTPKKYTLTLELGLATEQTTTVEVTYNVIPDLPVPEDPSGKFGFTGWKIQGTNNWFVKDVPYTFTEDITLVAQWNDTYTITLELNLSGATITSTTVKVKYNEIPEIPTPEDPSGEYMFSRWKIKGTDTVFLPKQPYTYTEDKTLVAQWDRAWTDFL